MAVAVSGTSVNATQTIVSAPPSQADETRAEPWVQALGRVALGVFLGVPVLGFLAPHLAGRLVWTVAVAGLPLVIVIAGYHRWRRICPLAFFSQLPARLGRPGRLRASPWLQANYYYVAFAVFLVSLWLRLVATNGDGPVLASFFILLSLAAMAAGALFTGKTWCNYFCPVSFIEKIYTEPRGLRETANSQCEKCTACKAACPDINQENGYWKEIKSLPKRFAYFAFPGLVFAFYFYYYAQSGAWEYYFGGRWTHERLIGTAFLPGQSRATAGFFFLPALPRAAAAALTLVLGAVFSYALFSLLERYLGGWLRERGQGMDEAGVRHTMFTLAGFTAFVTFYGFAGAPTIRLVPWAPHFFQILVMVTATLFLARRLTRRQRAFAEETLARQIIRRWEWDTEPPRNLQEALLIHTIRSQTRATGYAQLLEIYKDAVREVVASGFVSRAEVQRLEALRSQLQISKADHEKMMEALDEEERAKISDPSRQVTAEKRLQLETYARALGGYLERVSQAAGVPDDSFVRQLRLEYGVTPEEHAAVLDQLLGRAQGVAARLAEALAAVEGASKTIHVLEREPSPAAEFLAELLRQRRARAVEGLMRGVQFAPDDQTIAIVRDGLLSSDEAAREAAIEALGASLPPGVAERLHNARREAPGKQVGGWTLADFLRALLSNPDPYVRASALYLMFERGAADDETLGRLTGDEHATVRETALCARMRAGHPTSESRGITGLITIEKMMALRAVPLFSSLEPEDLAELARASAEKPYAPGESLCVEGEPGDEVFVLLQGEVEIARRDGGESKVVGTEKAGGFIGEMAVLDPAPRAATVRATAGGAQALVLDGGAFRTALGSNPAVADGVIRTLAKRLRGGQSHGVAPPKPEPAMASRRPA